MNHWSLIKNTVYLTILFIFFSVSTFSQQILWEKKFGWLSADRLTDGVQVSPYSIIGIGESRRFGGFVGSNSVLGMVALKINTVTGDTLWLKSLNQYCYSPRCILGNNGWIYVVSPDRAAPFHLKLTTIDTNGVQIFRKTLDSTGQGPSVERLIRTTDGNFLLVGTRTGLDNISNDMHALKFDGLGNVLWERRFTVNPNCGGNHVEETAEGHYVLSGNAGARIWRIKVDSAGEVLENNFLYQTPSFINFNEYTSVNAHPYSSNIVSGMMSGSTSRFYLGRHQTIGNEKEFGGERAGGVGKPFVNINGDFWIGFGSPDSTNFKKLSKDSVVLASIPLRGRMGAFGAGISQLIYLNDESAIGLGALGYLTSQSNDFYFCRITNVGVPYDPSVVVSSAGLQREPAPVPFPNPVAHSLIFSGLQEESLLSIYSLSGQRVRQFSIKPYQHLYLRDLPPGLYPYRLQGKTKGYSGKLVKE